jgi:hypothetical protein
LFYLDVSGAEERELYRQAREYSELMAGYLPSLARHFYDLSAYAGQAITLKFTGSEDSEYQMSFVVDDTTLNVS